MYFLHFWSPKILFWWLLSFPFYLENFFRLHFKDVTGNKFSFLLLLFNNVFIFFHFLRGFSFPDVKFTHERSFFLNSQNILSHPSAFCGFRWVLSWHSNWYSLVINMSFFSGCFQEFFSFSLVFWSLIMMCLAWTYLCLSYLMFA